MKINRIITAEGKSGVIAPVDEALDTETAALTNIWASIAFPTCRCGRSTCSLRTSRCECSVRSEQFASIC